LPSACPGCTWLGLLFGTLVKLVISLMIVGLFGLAMLIG